MVGPLVSCKGGIQGKDEQAAEHSVGLEQPDNAQVQTEAGAPGEPVVAVVVVRVREDSKHLFSNWLFAEHAVHRLTHRQKNLHNKQSRVVWCYAAFELSGLLVCQMSHAMRRTRGAQNRARCTTPWLQTVVSFCLATTRGIDSDTLRDAARWHRQ